MKPPYGFRFNERRDGLVVYEPEMAVVEKVFSLAAEGLGTKAIQTRLHRENIPSPRGCRTWHRATIKRMVLSDVYLPRSYEETAALLSPEAALALEPGQEYGIRWANRVSREAASGLRAWRGRRATLSDAHHRPQAKPGGVDRRSRPHTIPSPRPRGKRPAYDGRPPRSAEEAPRPRVGTARNLALLVWGADGDSHLDGQGQNLPLLRVLRGNDYKRGVCNQKAIRAERVEPVIWEWFANESKNPERIREGFDALIDHERSLMSRGDPDKQQRAWAEQIAECTRLRARISGPASRGPDDPRRARLEAHRA